MSKKAEKKQPWFKFYPSDWAGDRKLRMCSIGARGLWMELLCVMHEAEPYGYLVTDGRAVTNRQIAALAGISLADAGKYMAELASAGVFSSTDDGKRTIYSRRMVRDKEKAQADRENGKGGGNPALKYGVNPPDKGDDKAQSPEATTRNQNQKNEREASPSKHVDDVSKENRQTLIDESYKPGPRAIEYAYSLGMKAAELEAELSKFIKRCVARRISSFDPDMDFKLWCDRWLEFSRKNNPTPAAPASIGLAVVNQVLVIEGTTEEKCWQQYTREKTGRGMPIVDIPDGDGRLRRGWYRATLFPPGYDEATGERLPPKDSEKVA